ncbi:cobalt-precorrin-6A reductase [Algirhabdus cladophorae]|uniref:cobalt-precorrin-6A reductase n=1 Tax=Algirhabdus cladophorae TaxID=3377108 RepID=UPI003B84B13E
MSRRILVLAGTGEAKELCARLRDADIDAVASLAGATRTPDALAVTTRHGGFGGADAFADYLAQEDIQAVVDATHPFASAMSLRSAEVCRTRGVGYLQLLRPAWASQKGDQWTLIDQEEDAARIIGPRSTVFLATGRQTLERFVNLQGRRVICRQIDPPTKPFPFEGGEYLIGRPPFTVLDETILFRQLGVDWLVVKNAGGTASRSKLDAARALKLRVAMINRPPQPEAPKVATVQEAFEWVKAL